MHTCLGIKIFQGDFLRGLFFMYNGGNLHFSFGFGGNFVSALSFFYCQIIVYVVGHNLVEEKGGETGKAYFAELILPQPQPFSNSIDWMYQLLHFCSWFPIVILLLLLSWFCIFLKAITYLQSAYRLKGEDIIEAHDITEIAGVWYYSCQYYWDPLRGRRGGVCMSLIWISNLVVSCFEE